MSTVILSKVTTSFPNDPNPHPKTPYLSELVKLFQEANKREDVLKLDVEHWHQAYLRLHQEYSVFKSVNLCDRCQTIRDTKPPGDTITLCTDCGRDKETTASLTLKLEKRETELSC